VKRENRVVRERDNGRKREGREKEEK